MPELARFLKKGQFSADNWRVKRHGLQPMYNQQAARFETSVFFFDDNSLDDMWHVGDRHLGWRPSALGAAISEELEKLGLLVTRDDDPPGHAVIVNWPEAKVDQVELATELEGRFALAIRASEQDTDVTSG